MTEDNPIKNLSSDDIVKIHLNCINSLNIAEEMGRPKLNTDEMSYVLCLGAHTSENDQWVTIRAIRKIFRNPPATVSGSIDRLVEMGFVKTQPDPEDTRSKILVLTDYGRKYYQSLAERLRHFNDDAYGMRIGDKPTPF